MIDDALREELSALLDGALPEDRARELRGRIDSEPALRAEYEELSRAVASVRALPRARAPAELRGRVRESIRKPLARRNLFRLGGLAAAAAVLLAAGIAFHLRREPPARYEAKTEAKGEAAPSDVGGEAAGAPEAEASDRTAKVEAKAEGAGAKKLGAPQEAGRGAPAKEQQEKSLLDAVAKSREVLPDERKEYLRRVSALGNEKALEHIRALFPEETLESPSAAGSAPLLAAVLLEDRDEAVLVKGILESLPRAETGAAAMTFEQEEKDQLTTEVTADPDDLERVARWLALLDLGSKDAARPRVAVEAKREAAQKQQPRSALVRLRYGKPPEKRETREEEK